MHVGVQNQEPVTHVSGEMPVRQESRTGTYIRGVLLCYARADGWCGCVWRLDDHRGAVGGWVECGTLTARVHADSTPPLPNNIKQRSPVSQSEMLMALCWIECLRLELVSLGVFGYIYL